MLAGIGCGFAGLCYAEMASAVPVAGSAYTYATLGEFLASMLFGDAKPSLAKLVAELKTL